MVFGNGVVAAGGGYELSTGSAARVRTALAYAETYAREFDRAGAAARIVFSGGWAHARQGAPPPPEGCREGDLMLQAARAAGLDRYAGLRAECRSRSTLENFLHTAEDGLLGGYAFDARRPLGVVTHAWHLPRVRYLAGKVLGLRGRSLLDVPAAGPETGGAYEYALRFAARVWFCGAREPAALRRREERVVGLIRGV